MRPFGRLTPSTDSPQEGNATDRNPFDDEDVPVFVETGVVRMNETTLGPLLGFVADALFRVGDSLIPRVVVILEDVFSAVAIETASSEYSEKPLLIESSVKGELPLSPVAGDASQSESLDLVDPAAKIEDVDSVLSIQRQMFRTDI